MHPSQPATEFVVELASSVVSDAVMVSSGTVSSSQLTTTALVPYALVYIVGGDVRIVPMQANGVAPISGVQRAMSTTACQFVAGTEANDYATPENSRFIVSTAGADGQCGTVDDERAEVKLAGAAGLSFAPITGDAPLGVFRDIATLAPRGWIYPRNAFFWGPGTGTPVVTRGDAEPAIAAVVAATYRQALVDDGTQLSVLDFPSGTTPTQTRLDAGSTAGGGWVGIGFDTNNFYAYRNSSPGIDGTWAVLRVSRATPSASMLASGNGLLSVASMGSTQLYATVRGAGVNSLLAISKTSGVPVSTLESTPESTLTSVLTSANGVHELWRVVNVDTAAVSYTIEMIDRPVASCIQAARADSRSRSSKPTCRTSMRAKVVRASCSRTATDRAPLVTLN